MQLFQLRDGPWERLFNGSLQGHEIEVYSNPQSVLLVLVYEKQGERVVGAVADLYQAFHADGDTEDFLYKLPLEALVVARHDRGQAGSQGQTLKFLLLASQPVYVPWKEEEFVRDLDEALQGLAAAAQTVKDVAKGYDLKLVELHQAEAGVQRVFFSQPLMVPLLASNSAPGREESVAVQGKAEARLGRTMNGLPVTEPLEFFARTLVVGGKPGERRHVLHLLLESALLSNLPAVVFAEGQEFDGLAEPAKDAGAMGASAMASAGKTDSGEAEPMGFPIRHFKPLENLFVDLNLLDSNHLLDSFGVVEQEVKDLVKLAAAGAKLKNLDDLILRVKTFAASDKLSEAKINHAVRVLAVIDSRYKGLFVGSNDFEEIAKNWLKAVGRTSLIHLQGLDDRARAWVVHNVLKGLMEAYRARGESAGLRAWVALPEAREFLERGNADPLAGEITQLLLKLPDYGVGVAVSADKEMDLKPGYAQYVEARAEIVAGDDCGLNLRGRKNYRVLLRPGLSRCGER